jgi:vacuolar protein sorting-associated protein IST1
LKKKKGQEQNKLAEKEIGELVKQEKDEMARLRVEQLVREQHLLEAYDMLELFCEIVITRLQLINMYPCVTHLPQARVLSCVSSVRVRSCACPDRSCRY